MALEIRDVIDAGDLDEQIKNSVTRTHAGTPDPTDKENHELAVENGQAVWKPMRVTPKTITQDITVKSGTNVITGSFELADGFTITIEDGAELIVV